MKKNVTLAMIGTVLLISGLTQAATPPTTLVVEENVSLVRQKDFAEEKILSLKRAMDDSDREILNELYIIKQENFSGTPIPQRRTLYANLQTGQIRVEIKDLRDLPAIIERLKVAKWQIINLDTSITYIIEGRGAKSMVGIKTNPNNKPVVSRQPISKLMTGMERWLLRAGIIPDQMEVERSEAGMPIKLSNRAEGRLLNEVVLEDFVSQGERTFPQKITEHIFFAENERWTTTSTVLRVEVDQPIGDDKFAAPKDIKVLDATRVPVPTTQPVKP